METGAEMGSQAVLLDDIMKPFLQEQTGSFSLDLVDGLRQKLLLVAASQSASESHFLPSGGRHCPFFMM